MAKTPRFTAPSGTRDFGPDEASRRQQVFTALRAVFERYGFVPLETPAFERLECLTNRYGDEGEKLIFKILKRGAKAASGEADLALRYDLTVPLVRYFGENRGQLPRPFKRYQIGSVWRADRPGRGRFREFTQCDIDVLGAPFGLADAEVVLTLIESLRSLGLPDFTVRLNSRDVLRGLLEVLEVPEDRHGEAIVALDKLDKIGADGVARELEERGFEPALVKALAEQLAHADGGGPLRERLVGNEVGERGLAQVDELISLVAPHVEDAVVRFDPFLARGLDYYTGPVFEVYAAGLPSAIAAGGRYDGLVASLTGEDAPACGGSLGLERVLLLSARELPRVGPDAVVTIWDADSRAHALALAQRLRAAGVRTELAREGAKLRKQLGDADTRGARFVVMVGPDERARGEATLKELATGRQETLAEDALPARLVEALAAAD